MQDDSLTIGENTVKNYRRDTVYKDKNMEERLPNFRVFIHVSENLFLYSIYVIKLDLFLMS